MLILEYGRDKLSVHRRFTLHIPEGKRRVVCHSKYMVAVDPEPGGAPGRTFDFSRSGLRGHLSVDGSVAHVDVSMCRNLLSFSGSPETLAASFSGLSGDFVAAPETEVLHLAGTRVISVRGRFRVLDVKRTAVCEIPETSEFLDVSYCESVNELTTRARVVWAIGSGLRGEVTVHADTEEIHLDKCWRVTGVRGTPPRLFMSGCVGLPPRFDVRPGTDTLDISWCPQIVEVVGGCRVMKLARSGVSGEMHVCDETEDLDLSMTMTTGLRGHRPRRLIMNGTQVDGVLDVTGSEEVDLRMCPWLTGYIGSPSRVAVPNGVTRVV